MPIKPIFAHLVKKTLRRSLGTFDLFAIGYGDLGGSIYYALGVVALYSLGATPISLAIAGCVFICTAFTYAEMSSTFPESGGTASFARHAFNDLISFIAGWGLLLDYIVTIAISAFAVTPYLGSIIPIFNINYSNYQEWHLASSCLLILFLLGINILGTKRSTTLSLGLAVLTILTQLLVVVVGAFVILNLPYVLSNFKINMANNALSPTWDQFIKGTAMAMVAYTGIESIAQLSAETKNPGKNIPRAIFMCIGILLLLYFGITLVALSAISPTELGTKYIDNPLAGIVQAFPKGGNFLAPWIGIAAAFVLFISTNAGIVGSSRMSFFMGEHYQLPNFFFTIHPRYQTPYVSLTIFSFLAIIIVLASRGKMMFLADLYNFGASLAFFFDNLSLIILRIKQPHLARPYKVPFNIPIKGYKLPISAILGCMATFSIWVLVIVTKPEGRIVGFSWLALGTLMYLFYRKRKKIAPTAQIQIEKVKIPEYKSLSIKNILIPVRGTGSLANVILGCEIAKRYHSQITFIHILEVAHSLPFEIDIPQKEVPLEGAFKRVEAIVHEYSLVLKFELIRSRNIKNSLVKRISEGDFDLVIMGTTPRKEGRTISSITSYVMRTVKTPVWICGD